jgi:hypothetical protein
VTYYIGDSIEITAAASDFDGIPVTAATGTARLSILETGGDAVPIKDVEMPFSGPDNAFVYVWDTLGIPEGGYRAKIEMLVGGRRSVEARSIVLYDVDED